MTAQKPAAVSLSPSAIRPQAGLARMYGHFRVPGGSERFYDRICEQMNFPAEVSPGLLGHFAGRIDGGWEVIDLWREDEAMEHVFSRYLVDAISSAIELTGERVDVEPEMREIARLVVGPDAAEHALDRGAGEKTAARGVHPIGVLIENLGGDSSDYMYGCDLLGFPASSPDGLIVHLAGECADGWRVFECWESAEHCAAWYEHVEPTIAHVDRKFGRVGRPLIHQVELVRAFVSPHLTGGGWLPL